MIKIGITGSLASGKTTASRILSAKRGPLFSADDAVKELYQSRNFKILIRKKFGIKKNKQIKTSIKKLILNNKSNLKKLEKIIEDSVDRGLFKNQNNGIGLPGESLFDGVITLGILLFFFICILRFL